MPQRAIVSSNAPSSAVRGGERKTLHLRLARLWGLDHAGYDGSVREPPGARLRASGLMNAMMLTGVS